MHIIDTFSISQKYIFSYFLNSLVLSEHPQRDLTKSVTDFNPKIRVWPRLKLSRWFNLNNIHYLCVLEIFYR